MNTKTLFSKKGYQYSIVINRYGLAFQNETSSRPICLLDDERWVCECPESLPRYIKEAMYTLLIKLGKAQLEDQVNLFNS